MAEGQTTIDGVTYPLEAPFLVIATQNPIESQGTFPLPEAQNDRFLMKLSLGYPDPVSEREVLSEYNGPSPLDTLGAVCSKADVVEACRAVSGITVSDRIKDYIIAISNATRESDRLRLGVSPRASLAMMRAAQAYAGINGRDYVLPDDVKAVSVPVLSHRIISRSRNTVRVTDSNEIIISYIVDTIPAPIE
ncbi:MAG: MoxR family ATPase, partial [Clostridia bacterium]|nr:MoxR family ATPase [Clostridia bacterium]